MNSVAVWGELLGIDSPATICFLFTILCRGAPLSKRLRSERESK